jgi:hypothetical protein
MNELILFILYKIKLFQKKMNEEQQRTFYLTKYTKIDIDIDIYLTITNFY